MNKNSRNALIALGLAGVAFWKWVMKTEEKEKVKMQVKDLGKKAMEKVPAELKEKIEKMTKKESTSSDDSFPLG